MYILIDVETDGLDYTKAHCVAMKVVWSATAWTSTYLYTDLAIFKAAVDYYRDNEYGIEDVTWVAHNMCSFDYFVMNDLILDISNDKVLDTFVISKLMNYKKYYTHSLEEIGLSLGCPKSEYIGGWETYTAAMGEYCVQDVEVLAKVLESQRAFIEDPANQEAIKVEHDMAFIARDIQQSGFAFNKTKADTLLSSIKGEMEELESAMDKAFPPKLEPVKTNTLRTKGDGTLYANVQRDFTTYPEVTVDETEGTYTCYDYKKFNPGSPVDRIDVLWDAGWKPTEKTKGHIEWNKKNRGF